MYLYATLRNMDEQMFKVTLNYTNRMEAAELEVRQLFREQRAYSKLISKSSDQRKRLNQIAFEISVEKNYVDIATIFIQNEDVLVTWEMIRKMLSTGQEYLVK